MNTCTDNITLTINDVEFEAIVEYNFYKGEPRITHLPPEDCQEGSADEYEITSLWVVIEDYDAGDGGRQEDVGFLIEDLEENIIEQLRGIRGEDS